MLNLPEGEDALTSKMESTKKVVEQVNTQFKNPDMTTFVCVCIPEVYFPSALAVRTTPDVSLLSSIRQFLSLYETERLVQELNKFEIDTQNIVINQVLYPESSTQFSSPSYFHRLISVGIGNCGLCLARARMQQKYIDQMYDLYEDFHIVKVPLQKEEIRGVPALLAFSEMLLHPPSPAPPQ